MPTLAIVLAPAATGGAVDLPAAPPSADAWIQHPSGSVARADPPPAVRTTTVAIRSAVSGKPLAGALAWLVPADEPVPSFTASEIRSDSGGLVRIGEVPGYVLRLAAAGHELIHRSPPYPGTIVLWPAEARTIRASASGEPVARVRFLYALDDVAPAVEARTDASGRITFPYASRAGIRVEAVDDRFAFASLLLDAPGESAIELRRSAALRAAVRDAEGRPIREVEASAWIPFGESPREVRKLTWRGDDDGIITVTSLPPGSHRITFRAPHRASRVVRSDDPSLRAVVLANTRTPALRVVSAQGPIEGALVMDRETETVWTTGADGIVRLEGADAARRPLLRISADDHLGEEIALAPDDPAVREVRLERGAAVRFRLLDGERGLPVTSIRIRLNRRTGFRNAALTRTDGEYEIGGFEPGRGELTIAAPGHLPLQIPFEAPAAGIDLGTLFLSRGASIEGTLVSSSTGQPLAGASISVPRRSTLGTFGSRFFGDVEKVVTDEQGRFTISGLEGGTVCGSVTHPLLGEIPFQETVEPDASTHLGAREVGGYGSVSGRILDGRGDPVEEATAELRAGPLHSPCAVLAAGRDETGSFLFPRVAPGLWQLVAMNERRLLATKPVTVTLGTAARADLRVAFVDIAGTVALGGENARGGRISLKRSGHDAFVPPTLFISYQGRGRGSEQQVVSDMVASAFFDVGVDGSFSGRAQLDPGEYEVTFVQGSSFRYARVHIADGQEALKLPLAFDGHRLAGWVVDSSGTPAPNVLLHIEDSAGSRIRSERSAADGSFAFSHVPEGSWTVRGNHGDLEVFARIEVRDARADLTLALATPVSPSIDVAIEDGEGARVDTIYATDGRATFRAVTRGTASVVRIPFLSSGRYRVLATDSGGAIYLGPEVVLGSSPASVTFSANPPARATLRVEAERAGEPVRIETPEGFPIGALLGMTGRSIFVEIDGTAALPPLSEGEWKIGVGANRAERVEIDASRGRVSLE